MKFGNFSLFLCTDGILRLDGGAMFGIVPKVLWEKTCRADKKNRIPIAMNSLVISTCKHNILVDTGIGSKGDKKLHKIYGIERNPPLEVSLAAVGLKPQDIDLVINTHLHLDHAGGNTVIKNGRVAPNFPRARYVIQKGEWEDAIAPNEHSRASYLQEDFLPLEDFKKVELVEGDAIEIEKGITLLRTGGHTRTHQCIKIESSGRIALFLADLVPTTTHIPFPYIAAYDLFPMETLEKKKALLAQALEESWLLIFQHDTMVKAGYLKRVQDKIVLGEVVKL